MVRGLKGRHVKNPERRLTLVIGHSVVVSELEVDLPRVSLFLGPKSVGKTTVAQHLKGFYGVSGSDYLHVEHLDAESVQRVVGFARTHPSRDKKLIVLQMDGSSRITQDALLLTLEETPPDVHFILVSSESLVPTLSSRAKVFHFPFLQEEEVEEVLREVLSGAANVSRLAKASGGQIFRAFTASKLSEKRSEVLRALHAFYARDATILEKIAPSWTADHTSLLEIWCQELITGRWRLFEPAEAGLSDRKLAIRLLIAIRSGIRPRLVVRSSIMDVWRDYI